MPFHLHYQKSVNRGQILIVALSIQELLAYVSIGLKAFIGLADGAASWPATARFFAN